VFDFTGANIDKLIIHGVGNKLKEDALILSQQCINISSDSLYSLLGKYFFQRFKDNGLFSFGHETDLGFNEIYQYVKSIFDDSKSFEINSQNIAKHLYEVSTHPNIKTGELFIAYIKGIVLNESTYDAIGIFKTENKEAFLKINNDTNTYTVNWEQGIDTNKLDKGCIVFNHQKEKGYNILIVDSGSNIDTKYWIEDFLGIKKNSNEFHKTKILVDACKEFIKKDFVGEKTDKAVMLNNVVQYINSNSDLDLDEFTYSVAEKAQCSEALRGYIKNYAEKKECSNIENFSVDQSAVKSIKRSIKNLITLDNDIEIKIKPSSRKDKQYLEKGFDDKKQMYFYKIYFNEEK
jgi:hypothetical protein